MSKDPFDVADPFDPLPVCKYGPPPETTRGHTTAPMAHVILKLVSDNDSLECTLAEFLEANADDPEAAKAIALPLGGSVQVGGGASPLWTITRIT